MEEVVARKANMIPGSVVCMVFGLIILLGGVILGVQVNESGAIVIGVVVGLILLATGGFLLFGYLRTPRNLITYKEGKLYFNDGTAYYPHEVTYVLVRLTRSYGVVNPTGGIDITVAGRIIKYKNVEKVKMVQQRLSDLRAQALASMNYGAQNAQNYQPAQPVTPEQPAQNVENAQPVQPDNGNNDDPFGV